MAGEASEGTILLDLDRPQHRAILRRYRDLARPEVPIRAIVTGFVPDRS
jgi:hypothetical protein